MLRRRMRRELRNLMYELNKPYLMMSNAEIKTFYAR